MKKIIFKTSEIASKFHKQLQWNRIKHYISE